jgi:uncharacterized GH25 family protein
VSTATRILVPLLLLGAAAGGAFYFLNQSAPVELPSAGPRDPAQPKQEPRPEPEPVAAPPPVRVDPPARPERTVAGAVSANAHADAAQGVKGRVLLPNRTPAAGVAVFLLENSMNDPIKVFLQNKSGVRTQPVSAGATSDAGEFRLGVLQPGKTYDLRVVSDEYPEINHAMIKVREEDWYDTGDLTLEQGALVSGRVVEEGTNAPVGQATVFLSSANQAHVMVTTPGRERGVSVVTDGSGSFRFANAPRQGLITLEVEAQGYATALKPNLQVRPEGPNEHTIELVHGQPIAGVAVDPDGKPIAGVTITAAGLSVKTPQTASCSTDGDGRFTFASLREGPYQLTAQHAQFLEFRSPPVMTGDTAVKLVLGMRSYAKLRVLSAKGAPIKSYQISLKRHFPNNPLGIGNVPEFPDRRINPGDYPSEFGGDWAVVRGLPTGDYVFQIQDRDHAKTLSPAFTVAEGAPPPEVEAVLTLGGVITGTVIDDRGQPVAGATVTTDMNGGFAADTGFFEIFKNFIPEKHSKQQVKTDGQGRFRIGKLAFAEYMIRVAHQDFCEGTAVDLKLQVEGEVVDAGTIQLARGAIVEGTTTVGGAPAGQVKVTVSVPQTEVAPQADPQGRALQKALFNATATSDSEGRFRLIKRVPPGVYRIHASRQAGGDLFGPILDIRASERDCTIGAGQEIVRFAFDLPPK